MKTPAARSSPSHEPLIWENNRHRIVVAPVEGGRVVSWQYRKRGELVKQQQGLDGGLMRVLVSPERYPGSSYITPHQVIDASSTPDGFRIHLRYAWNTASALAGILGWTDKVNPAYLDGLLLDKILAFDATRSTLSVDMRFSNLNHEIRWINPWLHSHFHGWVERSFVVIDGTPEPFLWLDQYWGGHEAPPGKTMRLVHTSADEKLWTILGSDTGWLDGMASYTKADFGPQSTDGGMELRGKPIRIEPHQSLRCNAFIALAEGPEAWKPWAIESPLPLFHRIESETPAWKPADLVPLLDHWAMPDEHTAGMMILSHLDKLPFSAAQRYSANRQFSGFRKRKDRVESTVWIYALRNLTGLATGCDLPADWTMNAVPSTLAHGQLAAIKVQGPSNLAGHESLRIRVQEGNREIARISVATNPTVITSPGYQVRQPSAYLDQRFQDEHACFDGHTVKAFNTWQTRRRRAFRNRIQTSITRPVPIKARVTERQEGPTCIREKVVVHTEPDMWVPLYLVRPRRLMGKGPLPVVLFLCGSGPGKVDMVPDETPDALSPEHDEQWPSPYAIANRMGCLLACPDHRGWGEWAEGNHSQQPGRSRAAGFDIGAMGVWDHLRVVDYLCTRPDVDTRYVFAMGSSGGGGMTLNLVGGHERITGGIISSAPPMATALPEHFFFRSEPRTLPLIRSEAAIVQIGAPRPVWIMDGLWDRCALPALPVTESERQAIFEQWHLNSNAGREAIRDVYRLLGAEDRFRASWFDGDHLAGFHFRNIREWLLHYWPEAFPSKLEP